MTRSHVEGEGGAAEHDTTDADRGRPSALRRVAKPLVWGFVLAAGAGVLLVVWLGVVEADRPLSGWVSRTIADAAVREVEADAASLPIYFRHPDGEPFYAAGPRLTEDGRAFLPVLSGEDVSFDDPISAGAEATATALGDAKRTILYYRNPMGLPDTSPVPKKDSMGMDYIPVYAGEVDDSSTVTISPAKVQRAGVRTDVATRRVLMQPIRAPGVIQFDERRVTVVATRAEAFVEEVASVTTGERVVEGQPLVRLYMPEIAAAGAQYLTDLGSGEKQTRSGGSRRRLENLGMPADAIDDLEATRKVPLAVTLTAPRDGVVLERNVVDGMRAMPGDVMFRLADTSVVWALVDVAERDLQMIAVGQTVNLRPRGYGERSFVGTVALVYPQINMATRTGRVRVELPNTDGVLLADMYVDAEVATGAGEAVVAVPASAVIDSGDRQVVVLDKGEGRFEPRDVKLGVRGQGFVEILDGIAEGDRVVSAGTFLIDAESNLKAALSGMVGLDQPQ